MTPSKTKRPFSIGSIRSVLSFNPKRSYDSPGGFYIQRQIAEKSTSETAECCLKLTALPNAYPPNK